MYQRFDLSHPTPHRFEFYGTGREYFRIWIVNLALSLITLGIYSAWAKVRRLRYFYGNTVLDGHSFDYHASPMAILKGRLLIVAAVIVYNVIIAVVPAAAAFAGLALFIWPWVINRSIAFQAQMTSYRSVRFNFAGSYWRAFVVYMVLPGLTLVSLGLLAPLAARARWEYLAENLRYGSSPFASDTRIGIFYSHLGATIVFAICMSAVTFVLQLKFGFLMASVSKEDIITLAVVLAYIPLALTFVFWRIGVRNIGISGFILAKDIRFHAEQGRLAFVWITASNLVLTLLSLGLLRPWAAVRSWRALSESTVLATTISLNEFVGETRRYTNVMASEFADLQSVDLGF